MEKEIQKDWKKELDEETYRVTREGGTEAPGTGKYLHHKKVGMYTCSNCKTVSFPSSTKFDSGADWLSFSDPVNQEHIELKEDTSHGMNRTEVLCKKCGAHLGHVFDDAIDQPSGKRYCINSCALNFEDKG